MAGRWGSEIRDDLGYVVGRALCCHSNSEGVNSHWRNRVAVCAGHALFGRCAVLEGVCETLGALGAPSIQLGI